MHQISRLESKRAFYMRRFRPACSRSRTKTTESPGASAPSRLHWRPQRWNESTRSGRIFFTFIKRSTRSTTAARAARLPIGIAWRVSPEPFALAPSTLERINAIGQDLLHFYKALNALYNRSARGTASDRNRLARQPRAVCIGALNAGTNQRDRAGSSSLL